ncbi:MAG: tetratricopeptide repeat protein [Candidatus Moraniibacteriota bacterium]
MFYLYFILPPVVIVASLALAIYLLSKKSLEISEEIKSGEIDPQIEESRISMEVKSHWLHFLEKIAHISKVIALRVHNSTERKLAFIKSKKNKIESDLDKKDFEERGLDSLVESKEEVLAESIEAEAPVKEVNNSVDAIQVKRVNPIGRIFSRSRKNNDSMVADDFAKFKEEGVMLSKEITYPEEKKEELESLLVERIASDPRDIEAYERLGDYYISQSNTVDAESCYKQVLKLNPQSLSVRNKLSRFKRKRF